MTSIRRLLPKPPGFPYALRFIADVYTALAHGLNLAADLLEEADK